jgi:hypothetical protein
MEPLPPSDFIIAQIPAIRATQFRKLKTSKVSTTPQAAAAEASEVCCCREDPKRLFEHYFFTTDKRGPLHRPQGRVNIDSWIKLTK